MSALSNICSFRDRVALVTGAGADIRKPDVARLFPDESGFITGVDIPVDGGRVLGPHGDDM